MALPSYVYCVRNPAISNMQLVIAEIGHVINLITESSSSLLLLCVVVRCQMMSLSWDQKFISSVK